MAIAGWDSWKVHTTVLKDVLHIVSEDLQQNGASVTHPQWYLLISTSFIGFPPFSVLLPHPVPWDCLPSKLLIPKSLSQGLLLR